MNAAHRPQTAESALWTLLRGRRLGGFRFRRRHPCGPFILDFFCPARRLAVELGRDRDDRRSQFLAARGITIVRVSRNRVLRKKGAILVAIAFALGIADPSS